jgi:ketopantoate reductase
MADPLFGEVALRIAVIGAGALGSAIAAELANSGRKDSR